MPGTCEFCQGPLTAEHKVREMMHGTREQFTYGECGECGSLRLLDIPDDLSRYYSSDYYSFSAQPLSARQRVVKRLRAEAHARGRHRLALRIGRNAGPPPRWVRWLEISGLDRKASILDIGCGMGTLLVDLKAQGFRHLAGADLFIERSTTRDGIELTKAGPDDLTGRYDLVMLNHSFEHMPDPVGQLRSVARLLNPEGWLMVRVPIAGSPVWSEYGTDWVSIDAPRHLNVPTHAGMARAVARAGLTLEHTLHESSPEQFWRSEQYRRDHPLFDDQSRLVPPSAAGITESEIAEYRRQAAALNESGSSSAAAFFIR